MKKALICVIITAMLITAMSINTITLAVGFKFAMSASATTVQPGDEITITMSVSDIDLGENGMNTLEGTLSYDKNVFEEVKSANITPQNGWVVTYNDENTDLNGKFLATKTGAGVKENQTLATIKLKVKANVSDQTTNVAIKNIASNDGTNLVEVADKTVSIKIETKTSTPAPAPTPDTNNSGNKTNTTTTDKAGTNTAGTNTNKATTGSTTNKNKNTNKTSLPKTGVDNTIVVVGIVVIVLTGIISYVKYKGYKGI